MFCSTVSIETVPSMMHSFVIRFNSVPSVAALFLYKFRYKRIFCNFPEAGPGIEYLELIRGGPIQTSQSQHFDFSYSIFFAGCT